MKCKNPYLALVKYATHRGSRKIQLKKKAEFAA